MGNPMTRRFINSGYKVAVYNRTASKATDLVKAGAIPFSTPAEAIKSGELIFSMLTDFKAYSEILTQTPDWILKNRIWIMMSTISPSESIELERYLRKRECKYIEAPVLGSIPQAKEGSLQVLAGGDQKTFESLAPLLNILGKEVCFFGETGKASAAKLALNQLIATLTASFSASFGFIKEHGVETKAFMELLRGSALYAPTFDKKLSKMEERNFSNPNFPLKHMAKDMDLIIRSFDERGINTGFLKEIDRVVESRLDADGENDYSSIFNGIVPGNNPF